MTITPSDHMCAKGANLPGVKAFFESIESLVTAEEGTIAEAQGTGA